MIERLNGGLIPGHSLPLWIAGLQAVVCGDCERPLTGQRTNI